mgnify:CR=1 FL=1
MTRGLMFDPRKEGGEGLVENVCSMQIVVNSFEKTIRRETWKRTN